jgi:hypothetical protein
VPEKRGRGQPSKLDEKVKRRLIAALEAANTYACAARAAGIGERTFFRWMERGRRASKGEYWQFRQDILEAVAKSQEELVRRWHAKTDDDWRAARDLLARRWPEEWMSREGRELTGKGGGPVQVSAQDVVQALDELEKWKRERGPAPSPGGPGNPEVP